MFEWNMGIRILTSLLILLSACGVLVVVVRILVSGPVPPVDFENLQRTGRPNDFLACPESVCSLHPDEISPVFAVPSSKLEEEWKQVISRLPRTRRLDRTEGAPYSYVQRSQLFGFPDSFAVRFVSLSESRSSLVIYSRSHYGYSDLGVNRNRARSLLSQLRQRLPVTDSQ